MTGLEKNNISPVVVRPRVRAYDKRIMMNREKCGRKRWCLILRHCLSIWIEGLRKCARTYRCNLFPGSPEWAEGTATIRQ
jgi:hypothetical protein